MNESQDNSVQLANALYSKLGEAFDLAEQLANSANTNQGQKQARRVSTRIHRLQGDAVEMRHKLEDQEK